MTDSKSQADAQAKQYANERKILTEYFAGKTVSGEVNITDYMGPPSGMSNETRFFVLHEKNNANITSRALVARWAPAGEQRQFEEYDIAFQYHAMKALAESGIAVPKLVLLEENTTILGSPFFVMEKVEGEVISDYPPGAHGAGYWFDANSEMRTQIWWRSLEVIAMVNRIDWRGPQFDFLDKPKDGRAALSQRLAMMRQQLDYASDTPIVIIERAFEWLYESMPENPSLALCWSDGRPGNIIWRDYEPIAAVDWETMYVGPPESDLAWFIIVDEVAYKIHGQTRLRGLPDTEQTIARYEKLLGRSLDSIDYYFVMQAALMAILMALTAKNVLAGGLEGFPEDFAENNPAIEILARHLTFVGAQ